MSLFRRKSIADLHGEEGGLKRALTATNLVLLGIGAIIGAGIFVLTGTAAAQYAGPAITLSFVLAEKSGGSFPSWIDVMNIRSAPWPERSTKPQRAMASASRLLRGDWRNNTFCAFTSGGKPPVLTISILRGYCRTNVEPNSR